MKICPSCQTRYEEDILRFCIKDGSPLVQEETPQTEGIADAVSDDSSDVTIVRKSNAHTTTPPEALDEDGEDILPAPHPARPRQRPSETRRPAYQPPTPQPNIFKVIVLTVICTVAVLAGIALVIWSLRGGSGEDSNVNANANLNANVDTNLNTNLNMNGFNFNMNANVNSKANMNTNANVNMNTNVNVNVNTNRSNTNVNSNANRANANVNANARPRPAVNAANAGTVNRPANSNRPVNRPFDAANATRPRNVRP